MDYKELPDITLKMLIEYGAIKCGEKVYADSDNKIIGTLDKEGAITVNIDGETKTFPFPSGAARAIMKTSINGWIFWRILEDGQYRELRYFKEKYKKESQL